jgi:hypothetical protein
MLFKYVSYPAAAVMIASSVWALSASSEAPAAIKGPSPYKPIQSISYEFGSKFMTGYFEQRAGICFIVMMVTERSDPDTDMSPSTATRLRLPLDPGQTVGFDSEEGRSVNLTCGEGAEAVTADAGKREKLVLLQANSLSDDLAASR